MTNDPIKIRNLTKFFDGRCVLDDITLNVPQGCIYGLLGRNGTGKTTIIRILLGLDTPTRGCTALLGADSQHLTPPVKARIGYVAEAHVLIQSYKVGRLIKLYKDLAQNWNDTFFSRLMETFRLPMDRPVKQLSMGMRAQLNLSLAMAIDPELLILDDPTLGLDTVARRQFLELAVDLLQKDGRTILFSSHILSDVERIADRIAILRAGTLVVDCPLEQLKECVKKLRIIFADSVPDDLCITEIISRQSRGRELTLTVANWNQRKQTLLETFEPASCTEIPMSLEDIFIECTRPDAAQPITTQQEA